MTDNTTNEQVGHPARPQNIAINADLKHKEGQSHGWKVAAVVVLGLSVGYACWQLSVWGLIAEASTIVSIFLSLFIRHMMSRGMIANGHGRSRAVPETPSEMTGYFKKPRWFILASQESIDEWLDESPYLRVGFWCLGLAVAFLFVQKGVALLLVTVTNPVVIVLAVGIGVSLILSPALFTGLGRKLTEKKKG